MKKKALVKKRLPVNPMKLSAMEAWLADLAEEGLFLHSFYGTKAKFEREIPHKATYRFEPMPEPFTSPLMNSFQKKFRKDLPPQEENANQRMRELYEEFGWEFICPLPPYFFVFRSTEENPPEIHTAPEVQAKTYERVCKLQKSALRFTLLFCGILLAFVLFSLKMTSLSYLVEWGYGPILPTVITLISLGCLLREFLSI